MFNSSSAGGGKKTKKKRPKKRQKTSLHTGMPTQQSPPHPRQRSAPSEAALALSARLKDLSSRKRLKEALALYHDPSNDGIRDGHHGSILVDCCSRCGDAASGERIVAGMEASGVHVSIQAKTALLKGYAHSGQMIKGAELYRDMCASAAAAGRDRRDQPNVRTLNTLLRGCLWTAASLSYSAAKQGSDDPIPVIAGGVVTSEEAWRLSKHIPAVVFDASSYEYSIALLCQALRCDEAKHRLDEMKRVLSTSTDGSTMESVAAASLYLARAYALLGKNTMAFECAKTSIRAIDESVTTASQAAADVASSSNTMGGKRAWKNNASGGTGGGDSRRSTSNLLFRSHRSTEMKNEAEEICAICTKTHTSRSNDAAVLPQLVATRLLYFSGGGTTDLMATKGGKGTIFDDGNATEQLMASSWISFGLSAAVGRTVAPMESSSSMLKKADRKALRAAGIDPSESVLLEDGTIDFRKVFMDGSMPTAKKARPINIELGAGSGDWIRKQAIAKPEEDFVSVELRSDRVAQTFAKVMLSRAGADGGIIDNVCSVGAECGSFLRDRVPNQSVDTVYVNHPEPPTQTFGSSEMDINAVLSGSEPAHMLNSETLKSAAKCLLPHGEGRLIIITDNKWYGMLLCKTFERVILGERKLLTQVNLEPKDGFQCVGSGMPVRLFEGSPNDAVGHAVPAGGSGSSYFDRLWRTGAGTHAERRKRYAIVMRTYREGDDVVDATRNRGGSGTTSSNGSQRKRNARTCNQQPNKSGNSSKKPSKKKSLAKQQRRNERRLLAKKQQQKKSKECEKHVGP